MSKEKTKLYCVQVRFIKGKTAIGNFMHGIAKTPEEAEDAARRHARMVDEKEFLDADRVEIQVQEVDVENIRAGIAEIDARNSRADDDDDQSIFDKDVIF